MVGSASTEIKKSQIQLRHYSKEEDRRRFLNTMEGFHLIKFSVLGPNLCLLEEVEQGKLEVLIGEGDSKWKVWFSVIRKWSFDAVDMERLTKLWVFRVPCFAWNNEFFVALANSL